jgi:hypothetical protein
MTTATPQAHDRHRRLQLLARLAAAQRERDERQAGAQRRHEDRRQPLERTPDDRLAERHAFAQEMPVVRNQQDAAA